MKPYIKALLFLAVVTLLELVFRKGIVPLPIPLSKEFAVLILFTLFAILTWLITKRFAKSDQITLEDLGITTDANNRRDFILGLFIGIGIWGLVSLIQSFTAGFEWTLRTDISMFNLLFGLVFIFIADLGTELYTRGYPLTRFKDSFGANTAIVIMVLFVSLKIVSFNHQGELLMYIILIPAIHTIFFSIIYFRTKRLGASLGIHTGANFVTNSIFDLRESPDSQVIPSGIFESNVPLEELSLTALQIPYVVVALLFSLLCYIWWKK